MTKKTLHIYTRVSSTAQVTRHSLTAQRNAGTKKAEELGYRPVYYEERGKSADKDNTLDRPEMNRLLRACEEGKVTDIFVTELDRFTRRVELVLEIDKMFREKGIRIHASNTVLDLNDSESRFITLLQSLLGERENRVKTERSIRGMTQAVKTKGIWTGVFVPYGYKKVDKCLAVDEEESVIYKEMVDMSLKGTGTSEIAKILNERGIQTRGRKVLKNGIRPKNKHTGEVTHIPSEQILWAPNTVCSILKNPLYKGRRRWKGELIPAPGIIDEETWQDVQVGLRNRRNYADKKKQHFYLLKGLLRCGICGRNLYGRIKPDERFYMCSSKRTKSCGLRSPNLDRLNTLIWNQVINSDQHLAKVAKEIKSGAAQEAMNSQAELDVLRRRKEEAAKRQEKLINLFELERIDLDTFDQRNKDHESTLEEIEENILALEQLEIKKHQDLEVCQSFTDSLTSARKMLQSLPEKDKRDVVRDVVENIVVNWDASKEVHEVKTYFNIESVRYVAHSSVRPAHLKDAYSKTSIQLVTSD